MKKINQVILMMKRKVESGSHQIIFSSILVEVNQFLSRRRKVSMVLRVSK